MFKKAGQLLLGVPYGRSDCTRTPKQHNTIVSVSSKEDWGPFMIVEMKSGFIKMKVSGKSV